HPAPPGAARAMSRPGELPEDSLMGHLLELRARLLKGVLAVLLLFVALLPFAEKIYARFAAPLLAKLPAGGQLVAIDVASPFFTPGLYRHGRRLARPLLASALLLFYIGCAFAWFLVLPAVFGFLTAVTPEGVAMMTDISRYLDFVLVILMAFGLGFELPVAVVVLVLLGVVSPAQLREARGYVIVGIFILAAVVTPPDVTSH